MNQNAIRRLLLIKVTEIVEVTETITIVIENNVLKAEQDSDCVSVIVTGILTDAPESNWIQPELNEAQLNSSAPDVVIKKMDKEESPSSPKSS